jgi:hypothetical protein
VRFEGGHIPHVVEGIALAGDIDFAVEIVLGAGSLHVAAEDTAVEGSRLAAGILAAVLENPVEVPDSRFVESEMEEVLQSSALEMGSRAVDRSLDFRKT